LKLLLDEMLSPRIARELRRRGHDAVAVGERDEWVSRSDDEVIELARRERRAVVTNNLRDFRRRAAAAALPGGAGHFGLVWVPSGFRRTRRDVGRLVEALEVVLAAHPAEDGLRNGEAWLG
jgi:predicted nuclease of predicted toxin-antitoxin system